MQRLPGTNGGVHLRFKMMLSGKEPGTRRERKAEENSIIGSTFFLCFVAKNRVGEAEKERGLEKTNRGEERKRRSTV